MKATKICKVCGAEYEYCHTLKRSESVYRWQDVACCPEHGDIYLRQVLEARGELPVAEPVKEAPAEQEAIASESAPAPKKQRKAKASEEE